MSEELFVSATQMSAAPNYNRWTFEQFAPYLGSSVLEVGCGVGNFTEMLLADGRVETLLSIDISEAAVTHCREKFSHPKAMFQCVDVNEISGSFDTILCMNVLEHIEDHAATLRHLLKLLAPGGTLFLLVPAHQWLYTQFDKAAGHHRRYTKQALRSLLNDIDATAPTFSHREFYFNSIGALGYFAVYRLLGRQPEPEAPSEISIFDRYIVPAQKHIEGQWIPFGISVVTIVTREES